MIRGLNFQHIGHSRNLKQISSPYNCLTNQDSLELDAIPAETYDFSKILVRQLIIVSISILFSTF